MNTHSHFHTHVNTHNCGCGRTQITAHTHVHMYETGPATMPTSVPAPAPLRSPSPVARRTRSKIQRATWENTAWGVDDKDISDLLDFLRKSDDPWERSLIPAVEKDAIDRMAKRAKRSV